MICRIEKHSGKIAFHFLHKKTASSQEPAVIKSFEKIIFSQQLEQQLLQPEQLWHQLLLPALTGG
jgi:hypothetical protein